MRFTRRRSLPRAATIVLAATAGLSVLTVRATTSGPPAGFTGAPFEATCTACHVGAPVNSGPTTFTISAPALLTPGGRNPVGVGFGISPASKWGFQVTARDGAGNPSGSWQVVEVGKTKTAAGGGFHHEHTAAGTQQRFWTMSWIAPLSLPHGPVSFHAAGNETNANLAPTGDLIYAASTKAFQASLTTASPGWPIGSTQSVTLTAPNHGGELGAIVPSDDPTPTSLGGPFEIQVNPFSGFFAFALQQPQSFQNILAPLSAAGQLTASIVIPNDPALVGLPLYFGGITADALLLPTEVSNRLAVKFQ